ncbi:hypothetical protein [Lactiplantibacillus fabifermentans]|uniref:ABC transporter, permease protein n=2 Tax=Lactiplantibacillus fabifermentans TaxID=483011 RepID=A0A0R2NKP1_9LACO|nr:hypothetical protein [Lactiplantibacillus fabifermentans]ETY72850.1 hypothetical protein LFAB_15485 [Lactiplantibacillus fabifermentans T30PCM01]KRO26353.1 hypothetical protein DY78_GL001047 [Lactiplantibacillus fabifermentans DSM 21115]
MVKRSVFWHQHRWYLWALLVLLLGLGAFAGLDANSNWQSQHSSASLAMEANNSLKYQAKTGTYVDRQGRHYSSKRAYEKVYAKQNLQLFRAQPTKKTHSTRSPFDNGMNMNSFFVIIAMGIFVIWVSRWRHLNVFLQTLGWTRPQIYRQQTGAYGLVTLLGIAGGQCLELLILKLQIPALYWQNFQWQNWLANVASDMVMGLTLLMLAMLATTILTNGIVAFLLITIGYFFWTLPANMLLGRDIAGVYLSRHWLLGNALALVIAFASWLLGQAVSRTYSSECSQNVVVNPWLRLPVLVILSMPVSFYLCEGVFTNFTSSTIGWPIVVVTWVIVMAIMSLWVYRPRWSQRFWQLFAILR